MNKVIGIDLGTTFSAIASLDDMGNPEVIPSIDDNRKITASAVYVNGNKVIVGDKALDYLVKEPNKVIVQTKREMFIQLMKVCGSKMMELKLKFILLHK